MKHTVNQTLLSISNYVQRLVKSSNFLLGCLKSCQNFLIGDTRFLTFNFIKDITSACLYKIFGFNTTPLCNLPYDETYNDLPDPGLSHGKTPNQMVSVMVPN